MDKLLRYSDLAFNHGNIDTQGHGRCSIISIVPKQDHQLPAVLELLAPPYRSCTFRKSSINTAQRVKMATQCNLDHAIRIKA